VVQGAAKEETNPGAGCCKTWPSRRTPLINQSKADVIRRGLEDGFCKRGKVKEKLDMVMSHLSLDPSRARTFSRVFCTQKWKVKDKKF